MKGKNWRDCAPEPKPKRHRRRRKGGLLKKCKWALLLFVIGYVGFTAYYYTHKPVIALDAGHGGADSGAEGIMNEVELTERTVAELQTLLEEDGRFTVVLSREAGEGMTIDDRNHRFRRKHPALVLSIHGNANDNSSAKGFECYPAPPGYENHEVSLAFAQLIAEEMGQAGAKLRGAGIEGVRYGYYRGGEKILVDSEDTEIYDLPTFGILTNMDCPAVLAEQCFITNQADVEAFGTEEGCKNAAAAYYRAICRYWESLEEAA